jgi:hypothetical protein
VALDGDSVTLTSVDFYFHSVTECATCLMFGPGVLEASKDSDNNKLATLEETMFIVQVRRISLAWECGGRWSICECAREV